MSPVSRLPDTVHRFLWLVPLATAAACWPLLQTARRLPTPADAVSPAVSPASLNRVPAREDEPPAASLWSIFAGREQAGTAPITATANRFRLAGTFFAEGPGANADRRAILDDRESGAQRIVAENDEVGNARVVQILRDSVVLRDAAGEVHLRLNFAALAGTAGGGAAGAPGSGAAAGATLAQRLGRRVGPNAWVFSRAALLEYYSEVMDDPVRLAQLFDSLKPERDADGRISGYRLGIEGEEEFFRTAGLEANDVVRKVNSMAMTNKGRALYLIREFVEDRANAFVFEVERGGETVRLVYQVR